MGMNKATLGLSVFLALLAAGCMAPITIDPHADVATRMNTIADRFDEDRRKGGMAGVIADVEKCYASAIGRVIQVFALRDCLVLDYMGYRMDVEVRRRLWNQTLPYYEDDVAASRWTRYGMLARFASGQRLSEYMENARQLVLIDLARKDAAPDLIKHARQYR